jgi:hypothetical protein
MTRTATARLALWAPFALCLGLAFGLWLLFYPGLFSADSVDQIEQAWNGRFHDQHPPLLALCLHGVLLLGGDIQHLMLAQCTLGLLGVFCFAVQTLRFFFGDRVSEARASWLALGVVVVLLSPLSALPFYLMTFWKDLWVMSALCWAGALYLSLLRLPAQHSCGFALRAAGLVVAAVVVALARHNAVLLLPVFSVLLAVALRRVLSWRWALGGALLPVVLFLGATRLIYACFDVSRKQLEVWVMGGELIRLCYASPEIEQSLSCTPRYLARGYREHLAPTLYLSIFQPPTVLDPGYISTRCPDENYSRVRSEYWWAACHYPMALARVKWDGFRFHFVDNPCFKFVEVNHPKACSPAQPAWSEPERAWLNVTLEDTFQHPFRKWIFLKHGVWLVVGLACLAWCCLAWRAWPSERRLWRVALLLLLPLGYYLTYLIASIVGDFRFMYPATLWIQIAFLSRLAGWASLALAHVCRLLPADWVAGLPRTCSLSP